MRKLIIGFVIVCAGLISVAQTTYYNKLSFPFQGSNSPRAIVSFDTLFFCSFLNKDTGDPRQYIGIMTIDKLGDVNTNRIYKDTMFSFATYPGNSLIVTSDSCLFLCGAKKDTLGRINGYVMKIDRNLDTLWTRTYAHPDTAAASLPGAYVFNILTSVKQTYDGGYIITGNYSKDCLTGNERSYLLKIDSTGQVLWYQLYPSILGFWDIEIASDSGFVFPAVINSKINIVKANQSGVVLWNKQINYNTNPSYPIDAVLYSNSAYISSSYWYDLSNPYYGLSAVTVTKVNMLTQAIEWEKNYFLYLTFECAPIHQNMRIDVTSNGDVVVMGTSRLISSDRNPYKGVMLKLNSNGDSLWARWYGHGLFTDDNQFNDFVQTDDGGFLCVGWHEHPVTGVTYQNAWLVKLDSLGCDTPGCHTVVIQKLQISKTELQIFPNPTTDYITIKTKDNSSLPKGTLQIFNMQGALQMEHAIPKHQNQLQLNLSYLPTGLYLGRIVGSSGEGGGFRFVKE